METTRFDRWTRLLGATPSRRTVLSLVAALGLAANRFPSAVEAKNKNKKNRKRKKKNLAAAPPPPPPVACTPACGDRLCGDDGCGGSCGTCPGEEACLGNGRCAAVCDVFAGCPSECGCAASVEGTTHCTPLAVACDGTPQVCTSTAQCPPGQFCQSTECGQGDGTENRCVAVCTGSPPPSRE